MSGPAQDAAEYPSHRHSCPCLQHRIGQLIRTADAFQVTSWSDKQQRLPIPHEHIQQKLVSNRRRIRKRVSAALGWQVKLVKAYRTVSMVGTMISCEKHTRLSTQLAPCCCHLELGGGRDFHLH